MWTYFLVIAANCLFLFAAAICMLLLSVRFTQGQRQKFPWLRKLDGKQILLGRATVIFLILGYTTSVYKDVLTANLSFELSRGPDVSQVEKATPSGFELEIKQITDERAEEATDFFRVAERYFKSKQYQEAATNYQKSIDAVPTLSAYLNLGVTLRYISDYPSAEPVLLKGLQDAKNRGEKSLKQISSTISVSYITSKGNVMKGLKL